MTMKDDRRAQPVSIVLIVKDAMRTLAACLDSTREFEDVVVLDTGSTDGSLELARSYPHVRVFEGPFGDFADARNRAAELAAHDWICPLDADERFAPELIRALRSFQPVAQDDVYTFLRRNWFLGRRLRSRLGRDWSRRVYHRRAVRFDGKVHERLLRLDGSRPGDHRLPGWIEHEPYADVGHVFAKRHFYARPELFGAGRGRHPFLAALRAGWRFWRILLIDGALIDGWRGYLLARAMAHGVFLKYVWAYYAAREGEA